MRGNGSVPLFGRAEVVSQRDSVSSSYSCITCCPDSFYDGVIDPGYSSILAGDVQQLTAKERGRDCYGNIDGPYEVSGTWSAANPSIATVDSNGLATGLSAGTAGFSCTWTTYTYLTDMDGGCTNSTATDTENSSMDVAPEPDHVRVISDSQGPPASCPNTGVYVRQMTVQVVDANNQDVTRFFSIGETLTNISTNTCGNNSPGGSICAPADAGGQFTDQMAVSQNFCGSGINRNSGCGYTLVSTWSKCTLGTETKAIWQYDGETRSNIIKVNGQSGSYAGTYLYGPGAPNP